MIVLCRAFFAQFFTSETVSSDDELRRQMVWILAFLLLPGILLMIELFFDYQGIVLRAIRYQQFDHLDDTLEWTRSVRIRVVAGASRAVGRQPPFATTTVLDLRSFVPNA